MYQGIYMQWMWILINYHQTCSVVNTTFYDQVCQWFVAGRWFWISSVSSTNKTDHLDITEILLKVALNTINQSNQSINAKHTSFRNKSKDRITRNVFECSDMSTYGLVLSELV